MIADELRNMAAALRGLAHELANDHDNKAARQNLCGQAVAMAARMEVVAEHQEEIARQAEADPEPAATGEQSPAPAEPRSPEAREPELAAEPHEEEPPAT
ncbi:MAG TPA: hypothetical protein VGR45_15660 [Stellaceae bacterium]|nr:hypothetical protein [Stellaceae bacterium]